MLLCVVVELKCELLANTVFVNEGILIPCVKKKIVIDNVF